jgi:carboxyl-terminal processing protease
MPGRSSIAESSPRVLGFAVSLILALTLPITARASSLDTTYDKPATPVGLYHHVWQLVKEHYYDAAFNGQNWNRWEHRYDKHLKDMDDSRRALNTMLASLGDRYTRYLDPTAFEGEKEAIEAKLCGIGIQMGLNKEHKLIVIAPIEGTPAARAGLMPMDEIAEIDGQSTNGISVEAASKLIRGKIGTEVALNIIREKNKVFYKISRDEIPIKSVHNVMMLNNQIGYIRLGTFMSERASEEMSAALDKLSPARGIIIDLRNNPGGLVTNARAICSMFMDSSPQRSYPVIVSTVDRSGKLESARVNGRQISTQALVLLINDGSASASEIMSGALHDSNRAILIGQKSFGKGLVQSITRLEDGGGVNTTIARYLTPNNIDIHKKGITPDYIIDLKADDLQKGRGPWFLYGRDESGKERLPADGKDIQLKKALEVLNEKLECASVELKLTPFPANTNPFPNSAQSDGIN